ncbi:SAM-dependent methyltransferase [Crossiella equi]|uniref:SAM-dependent methyltransferase n=1 Tax=Crossiella equi TaxID=130796 RepID=A0ABS5A8V8_9PSEU|nr:class I SAM-dependent methyltransferase [Crossiella equi]MBP2473006.1 SAM-dependent methyltransferase [Crossiella equi]
MDENFWDERYRERERIWSGQPNGTLLVELPGPGRGTALDVGCGEGADAIWLAEQGWRVTGAELSSVALARAEAEAKSRGLEITWLHADLSSVAPPRRYDLVVLHYFPLLKAPGDPAAHRLLEAVAPGGTLLVVQHDVSQIDPNWHGGDERVPPIDRFYQPADLAALLGEGWTTHVHETRPRVREAPAGSHHTHDTVLRATRSAPPGP